MRDKILNDLKDAMKAQDKVRLAVIRSVKSAMQMEEINVKHSLSDDELIGVLAKQVKTRKESIVEFVKGNRDDLVSATEKEIEILNTYLPSQLSKEEAVKIIEEAFLDVKPQGQQDMGKIMGLITPKLKGRYDMKEVSSIVKEKIQSL